MCTRGRLPSEMKQNGSAKKSVSFSSETKKSPEPQSSNTLPGVEDITQHYNATRARQIPQTELDESNRQKGVQFKASLLLLIGFFFWIL